MDRIAPTQSVLETLLVFWPWCLCERLEDIHSYGRNVLQRLCLQLTVLQDRYFTHSELAGKILACEVDHSIDGNLPPPADKLHWI